MRNPVLLPISSKLVVLTCGCHAVNAGAGDFRLGSDARANLKHIEYSLPHVAELALGGKRWVLD